MQEQVERESIAIMVKASKLTAQALAKVLKFTVERIKENRGKAQPLQGKQSVKSLMKHGVPTSTIPIEGDAGLFERVARKWNVDYAFHQTDKDKYLLLFKSGQADAITEAFTEYSKRVMKRANQRPPVKEEMKRAEEKAKRENAKNKERKRERSAVRDER